MVVDQVPSYEEKLKSALVLQLTARGSGLEAEFDGEKGNRHKIVTTIGVAQDRHAPVLIAF